MRLPSVARKHKLLFTAAVTLTAMDVVTTYTALTSFPGQVAELNPFMNSLFQQFGLLVMIPAKAFTVLAATEIKTVADFVESRTSYESTGRLKSLNDYCGENFDFITLSSITVIMGLVVLNNTVVLLGVP
jgi:hypothetical protein